MNGCIYCNEYDVCMKYTTDKVTSFCAGRNCRDRKESNSDRLRRMTDEELADFILVLTDCPRCIVSRHEDDDPEHYCNDCKSVWLEWLKAEAKHE